MKPDTRPVFRNMINRIIKGEANALLCWHLNRLYRNQKEYGELAHLLETGVIQCIKTPEREYHPEDHGLLMAIEASMASQYVRDLRRDVNRGVREKAEKGWYPYKPKAGYSVAEFTKELAPDPVRFPLLRRALDLVLTGTWSVEETRIELNGWGYKSPRNSTGDGKPMTRSGMYRFLHDRFYTGVFQFADEWLVGKHDPMLTRQEFEKIQRILAKPDQIRAQAHKFPFTGLIRCGTCGCLVTAEIHTNSYKTTGHSRSYTYYHCTGRKGCPKNSIAADELEAQILTKLEGCRLDPRFVEWALGELKADRANEETVANLISETQGDSLRAVKVKLDSLWEMRHAGEVTHQEFIGRKALYMGQIEALEDEAHLIATKAERDRQTAIRALTFGRDAYDKFTRGGIEEKRQVAFEFGYAYVLTLPTLQIASHPIIDKFRTFECKDHSSQQIGPGDPHIISSDWRAMLDDIRTVASGSEMSFPIDRRASSFPGNTNICKPSTG